MPSLSRVRRRLKGLRSDSEGAAAVEFALIAFPFIALLFAVLEIGLVFMISTTMENAMNDAARRIRTGELQTQGGTSATFKSEICSNMNFMETLCRANLSVDVRTYQQFRDARNFPSPIVNGEFKDSSLMFTPGGDGDIVLVRAFFKWKLLTPGMRQGMQRLSNGYAVVESAATFRNEPFGD